MLKVYCYKRCTTCKKALKWLDDHNIPYSSVDISTSHPDVPTLREYVHFSGLPIKRFFNTSGNAYRSLGLAEKLGGMPDEEQLGLLASDGMLVKRPLAVGEDYVLVGFKEQEWAKRLL